MSITRPRAFAAALAVASLALAGCNASGTTPSADRRGPGPAHHATGDAQTSPSASPTTPGGPVAAARTNVPQGARNVPVDHRVQVKASHATISSVALSSKTGVVPGRISADKKSWVAASLLEPGTTYTVKTALQSADGGAVTRVSRFRTVPLTLNQQTFPSITPLDGQTVGVGMPVIVHFDVPVTDHARFERQLHVTSVPAQQGSWHWISDNEVHWRPRTYWKAGTQVTVSTDINSVPAGNGIYGQLDRTIHFTIGAAHIYKVNARTDQMQVFSNGRLLRTIPVTTGMPGFTTRSGIKVIVEKDRHTRMNSETIGIDPNSANGYDLSDVQFAMRMTFSGEFLHAAPWSVAYQGHSNVSHGCTGMSTANAAWLYHLSRIGDVVETTGTDKPMTLTNGYGDWNEPYSVYRQGSALH